MAFCGPFSRAIQPVYLNVRPVLQAFQGGPVNGVEVDEDVSHEDVRKTLAFVQLCGHRLFLAFAAVNRAHTRIDESDILGGENEYSRFALNSLIVEAVVKIPEVENLLMYFVQSSEIITESDILSKLIRAAIPEASKELVIEWLARLTFIGFEAAPNRFDFLYDEQDLRKLSAMARKTSDETTGGLRRFRIHPAFHAFLEIAPHRTTTPGQMVIIFKRHPAGKFHTLGITHLQGVILEGLCKAASGCLSTWTDHWNGIWS